MHPDTDIITPRPKAAHTPGPWLYGQNHAQIRAGGDQWEIGLTPGADLDVSGVLGGRDDEYLLVSGTCREADARLMAAAPTMLAALRLALPELAEDLIALVDGERVGGAADWQPEEPLPADLDSDDMALIRAKKAAYDAVLAAIKQAEGRA